MYPGVVTLDWSRAVAFWARDARAFVGRLRRRRRRRRRFALVANPLACFALNTFSCKRATTTTASFFLFTSTPYHHEDLPSLLPSPHHSQKPTKLSFAVAPSFDSYLSLDSMCSFIRPFAIPKTATTITITINTQQQQ